MSTSKHAFNQVKSILAKLDRSIDDLRAKRLETGPLAGGKPAGQAPGVSAGVADASRSTPGR